MAKVIKAVFTGRFCTTRRVFQWDTDDVLQIVNLDLPANYTVDFSNSQTGTSVPVLATGDTVQIPADMFVPGSEIYAWVWISDNNGGYTKCQATIPIDARAQRTGTSPTPAEASAWDEAVDTLNDTIEAIPTAINTALAEAKASGEFDGADGNIAWTVDAQYTRVIGGIVQVTVARMVGPSGATAKAGDVVFISDGRFTQIDRIVGQRADTTLVGDLHGADGDPGQDGYSPDVTITEITGGHRVTITDEDHPDGQSYDVMDGEQGPAGPSGGQFWSATSAYTSPDYTWAFNKLSGPTGATPLVGDLVYYSTYRYTVTSVDAVNETVNCTIRASIRGQQGPAGQGVPVGGTTGQVLKKKSGTDYDTEWANESGGGGGTSDYTDLTNKPQINSVELSGNKSLSDLGITPDVFYATYGTSTSAEVEAAYQAGEIALVENNFSVFRLTARISATYHVFSVATSAGTGTVVLNNDAWSTSSKNIPSASNSTPQALGTAAAGSSSDFSRADHVHPKPTASDIGAYALPSGGIPKTDLASDVQTSLGKADTALQSSPVFVCTYGTTTNAEIEAAYQAGKEIVVAYNSKIYRLVYRGSATSHTFSYFNDSSATTGQQVSCSGDTWSAATAHELIRAPSSPSAGQELYYTGSAWEAHGGEVTVSTAGDVTQALDPGKIYHFTGAISSLTLTLTAASAGQLAQYHFDFNSGSTAATISLTGVNWQGGSFAPAASKHYEVDILNGYGVVAEW